MFLVASWTLSAARENRIWPNLKLLGAIGVAALLLWILSRLVAALVALSRRLPPALLALIIVLDRIANFAAAAAAGAYLYVRWKNGDDLAAAAISLGVFALMHFRDEWTKQAAKAERHSADEPTKVISP